MGTAEGGDNVPALHEFGDVGQLTGARRGEGLVKKHQTFLDATNPDEQTAEIPQRPELDVGVTEPASNGDRLAEQTHLRLCVRFCEGVDEQHPAVLGPVLTGVAENGAGSREPSAPHSPITKDVAADPRHRARRATRGHVVVSRR